MKHFVYILKSLSTGRHYIGTTITVERRLGEHNRGKDRSVRGRGPYEVVRVEPFESRQEAIVRERQIKSYKGGEAFHRLMASPSSSPPRPSLWKAGRGGRTPRLRRGNAGWLPQEPGEARLGIRGAASE